jgi:hypothetical protein
LHEEHKKRTTEFQGTIDVKGASRGREVQTEVSLDASSEQSSESESREHDQLVGLQERKQIEFKMSEPPAIYTTPTPRGGT